MRQGLFRGEDLCDPLDTKQRKLWNFTASAELVIRLEGWILGCKGRGEDMQLAYLLCWLELM